LPNANALTPPSEENPMPPTDPTAADDTPTCTCGHVEDEHRDNGTCDIDGCECGGWDEE
jgi:hypothetical protein